jgi:hypothetical protein
MGEVFPSYSLHTKDTSESFIPVRNSGKRGFLVLILTELESKFLIVYLTAMMMDNVST